MISSTSLLDLLEVEHIKKKMIVDIVTNYDATDLIIEELFWDGKDRTVDIAMANDYLNRILIAEIINVLFDVILVRIETFACIVATFLFI